ncbi:MAG: hypothetical protein AB198_00680 [Parcubacteria bacterium C7867-003]|nr:MAG: hypothetical protein AB198_00680 [Parcubacteria bacterium C7867-003]
MKVEFASTPKRSEGNLSSEAKASAEPMGSKEVPEDVLRKILKMDDGK